MIDAHCELQSINCHCSILHKNTCRHMQKGWVPVHGQDTPHRVAHSHEEKGHEEKGGRKEIFVKTHYHGSWEMFFRPDTISLF